MSVLTRIVYFTIGIITASAIIIYGVSWLNPPMDFTAIGTTLNDWITAGLLVMLSLFSGTLIKSAILGRQRLD